jgi:hypothetical protein
MNKHRVIALIFMSLTAAVTLASTASTAAKSQPWNEFWRAHHVDPPPPRNFMEAAPSKIQVLNLTSGAITDQTARSWAAADRRRGRGDAWAECHLRLDLVNAGILGPPGLSGTDQYVLMELNKGAVAFSCAPAYDIEKMAVVAVSKEMKQKHSSAGLTDFVIVIMSRANGVVGTRKFSDGREETLPSHRKGDLIWQLDTGEFRNNAVIGPIWYQAMGWSCGVTRPGTLDDICRLVQPN